MKWTLIDPPKGREMEERKDSDGKITEEAWERVLHPERIQCRCTFVDPSNCNNKRYVAIVSGMALDNSSTWTNPSQAAVCRVKNSRGGRSKDYVKKNLGFRISMLILDVDNYEGTLEILNNLYKKMAKGGIIVFDEYALQGHGESDAVDEFFKNKKIKLKSFSWANSPTAYATIK